MQIRKQILSVQAEISLDLLPISENTRKRAINMEAGFNALFCKPCEVARKTELISTTLFWICFKEKKNTCKLVTQFLIISNKIMPKSTLFPSSVVKFTEKPWYLVVSLKTLYLKRVMKKHST